MKQSPALLPCGCESLHGPLSSSSICYNYIHIIRMWITMYSTISFLPFLNLMQKRTQTSNFSPTSGKRKGCALYIFFSVDDKIATSPMMSPCSTVVGLIYWCICKKYLEDLFIYRINARSLAIRNEKIQIKIQMQYITWPEEINRNYNTVLLSSFIHSFIHSLSYDRNWCTCLCICACSCLEKFVVDNLLFYDGWYVFGAVG